MCNCVNAQGGINIWEKREIAGMFSRDSAGEGCIVIGVVGSVENGGATRISMRTLISSCLICLCVSTDADATPRPISWKDDTKLEWTFGKRKVEVVFHARIVESSNAAFRTDLAESFPEFFQCSL